MYRLFSRRPSRYAKLAHLVHSRLVSKIGFAAELVQGHKGVTVVIAPFSPREVWGVEPVALDARREGFEAVVVEAGCRAIDLSGSLAAAWATMGDAGVARVAEL